VKWQATKTIKKSHIDPGDRTALYQDMLYFYQQQHEFRRADGDQRLHLSMSMEAIAPDLRDAYLTRYWDTGAELTDPMAQEQWVARLGEELEAVYFRTGIRVENLMSSLARVEGQKAAETLGQFVARTRIKNRL